jgi:monoamine oxidase
MRLPVTHQATLDYVERFGLETRPFIGSNPKGFFFVQGQRGRVEFFGNGSDEITGKLRRAYPGLSLSPAELRRSPFDLLLERVVYPVLKKLTDSQRWSLFENGGAGSKLASWEEHTLREFVTKKLSVSVRLNQADWDYIARATGMLYLDSGTFAQFMLDLVPTLGTPMVEIVGGMEQLPNAFLRRLRSEDITLGAEVVGLDVTDRGVRVRWKPSKGRARKELFDFVLCTAPINRLRDIEITPGSLDGLAGKKDAWNKVQMEYLAKCLFHCDKRFWESEYGIVGGKSFTDESIQQCYYPSDNGRRERKRSGANQWVQRDQEVSGHAGVFTAAYMWGDSAQNYAELDDDEHRRRRVVADVDQLHGNFATRSVRNRIVNVRDHIWLEGFTYFEPGHQVRHQENMRKPIKDSSGNARVFFAGEHLGIIHGWILSSIVTALAAVSGLTQAANSAAESLDGEGEPPVNGNHA